MADKMEALGTVRTSMFSSLARSTMSVWVVALADGRQIGTLMPGRERCGLPKGIPNDQERDIFLAGISKDLVTI